VALREQLTLFYEADDLRASKPCSDRRRWRLKVRRGGATHTGEMAFDPVGRASLFGSGGMAASSL
jgi:hypothetical protein